MNHKLRLLVCIRCIGLLLPMMWWPVEQWKTNLTAARGLKDLRSCRRSGAVRTLIHSLPIPTIRLSQRGLPDNAAFLITVAQIPDYSGPC